MIEGRPPAGSELDNAGYPIPYMIFATTGNATAYCWEIEHAGIGVTGDTRAKTLITWLEEYETETGANYVPPRSRQLALQF